MRALLLATMVLVGSAASQAAWAEPQARPAAKPVKVVAAAASTATAREPTKRVQDQQEAMKALASVLYREDKIEESAEILDKLPRTN